MTNWQKGDTVSFIETGTIAHIDNQIATIDVRGIPHVLHVSHIIGTPEQAKRERIMAVLRQEFSAFRFEPFQNDDTGIMIILDSIKDAERQMGWNQKIQDRITELENQ